MSRSKSSSRWLKEHFEDEYVKKSWKDGYRSRAAYKLLELQERDRLLKPGMTVVDLGAAPGGWSQIAAKLVGEKGKVLALDILPMDNLADVTFLQGDFTEQSVYDEFLKLLEGRKVDWVLSDMAPNLSGTRSVDQPRAVYLVELAIEFANQVLHKGGGFVAKVFQGRGSEDLIKALRQHYSSVAIRKPDASRSRSTEIYLVAKGFKGIS
jgi:23S rRNA (uridine2552-2'-O)-methyltransferase